METLAILGGGKIGEALLSGLLRGERSPSDIVVAEKHPERAAYLTETYGVRVLDIAEAAASATTLILAVKPQDVDAVLATIKPVVTADQLVVSVAAGITTARLSAGLAPGVPVVRCMPNTPALVDEAMTAVAAGEHAQEQHLALAEALLTSVGMVLRVPESQMDAVTALSGSGPAYFFYLAEAMIEAGVLLGLPRALAADLVVQTAVGSALMLRDSGDDPVQLRAAVTSPGGTTAAAIGELDAHGVHAALLAAVDAGARRSAELGAAG
jgi:pyrroline-5-carboxylate reductase